MVETKQNVRQQQQEKGAEVNFLAQRGFDAERREREALERKYVLEGL